ncbi:MAG TPA: class I SAM-dependent methyltransferase [Bryobacteraceae bacterium]|nr:class I SAM-dependent methyltransferase [Bryobacteraceae bacterium]
MLNRKVVALGRKLIPRFVVDQINPFDRFVLQAVREFSGRLPANSLILDAGAGEAQYRGDVARAGHRYRAIDLGVGEGDWNYGKIDAWARVEALPFPPGTFDGMLSVAVLEHTPYPRQTLHEMARALKPGGQLMIIVPTMWEEHQMPHDYYRFTRFGAKRLLEEAGFAVDEIRPLGGYFWFMGRKFIDVLEFFERFPRALLWPFLAVPFGFVLPAMCTHLDWLDRDKYYTIGQLCFCRRVGEPGAPDGAAILP